MGPSAYTRQVPGGGARVGAAPGGGKGAVVAHGNGCSRTFNFDGRGDTETLRGKVVRKRMVGHLSARAHLKVNYFKDKRVK